MATSWGPWSITGGNGLRLGMDVYPLHGVDTNSPTVTVRVDYWVQNQFRFNDTQRLDASGAWSGSIVFNNTGNANAVVLIGTRDVVHTYTTWGSSPGTLTFSGVVRDAYNGSVPSHSAALAIPARPVGPPNPPIAVSAVRNSDTQASVSWGHNLTAQRPMSSATVDRVEFTGSSWGGWTTVATIPGTPSSFVDTSIRSNRIYRYRVRHNNSAGSSAFAESGQVTTTPSAPTGVAAAMLAGGGRIETAWAGTSFVTVENFFQVERRVGAAGAWEAAVSDLPFSTVRWIDETPGPGLNRYRVRVCRTLDGTVCSPWSESNDVSTIVPPLAPMNLTPTGTVDLQNLQQTFRWAHRDGGDGAPQSRYRIQTYSNVDQTWTVLAEEESTASEHVVPAGTFQNGQTLQWQVQTMGVESAGWGPYSTSAVITATSAPGVALVEPVDGQVLNLPPIRTEWEYSQAEGHPQASWEAELLDSARTRLELRQGDGTAVSTEFPYPIEDGATYFVRVRARSTQALWSAWSETRSVVIDILPPVEIEVAGSYDSCTGSASITLVVPRGVPGVAVEAVLCDVERSIGGGPWTRIIASMPVEGKTRVAFTDPLPSTTGSNRYRTTSRSATGMTTRSAVSAIDGEDGVRGAGLWVFVNYGPGFGTVLRVHGDPSVRTVSTRAREAYPLQGRRLPFPVLGNSRSREIAVSAVLSSPPVCTDGSMADDCRWDSSRDEWESAAWESGTACYRDWTGRRIFGILGDVECATVPSALDLTSLSFSFTGTDEPVVTPGPALAADGYAPAPRYRTESWR